MTTHQPQQTGHQRLSTSMPDDEDQHQQLQQQSSAMNRSSGSGGNGGGTSLLNASVGRIRGGSTQSNGLSHHYNHIEPAIAPTSSTSPSLMPVPLSSHATTQYAAASLSSSSSSPSAASLAASTATTGIVAPATSSASTLSNDTRPLPGKSRSPGLSRTNPNDGLTPAIVTNRQTPRNSPPTNTRSIGLGISNNNQNPSSRSPSINGRTVQGGSGSGNGSSRAAGIMSPQRGHTRHSSLSTGRAASPGGSVTSAAGGGGNTPNAIISTGGAARGYSPVQSQSRSTSRLKRIQQHLIKLSEQEKQQHESPDDSRQRIETEAKAEIQRIQRSQQNANNPLLHKTMSFPQPIGNDAPSSSTTMLLHPSTAGTQPFTQHSSSDESRSTPSNTTNAANDQKEQKDQKDALLALYLKDKSSPHTTNSLTNTPNATTKSHQKQKSGNPASDAPGSGKPIEENLLSPRHTNNIDPKQQTVVIPSSTANGTVASSQTTQLAVLTPPYQQSTNPQYPSSNHTGAGNNAPDDNPSSTNSKRNDPIGQHSIKKASRLKNCLLLFCVIALAVIAISAGLSFKQLTSIRSTIDEFRHSEVVSNSTSALLESLLNGETGTRGYQVTGMTTYLEPYNTSLITTPYYLETLTRLADDEEDEDRDIISKMTLLIANISAQWNQTITDRAVPGIGFSLARNDTLRLQGKQTMDAIRDHLSELRDREAVKLAQKYSESQDAITFMTITTGITLSLIAITVCIGGIIGLDLEKKGLQSHNKQLAILLKKAEESTQLKSVFLANMSHEIRTPMNGVLAMTRYLCSMELNPEQQEVLDTVLTSAESMMRLIDDLLLFSKMEAGKFRLCPMNFNLMSLLKPLDEMFAIRCAAKPPLPQGKNKDGGVTSPVGGATSVPAAGVSPVQWTMQVDENLPQKIYADSDRLRQVLTKSVNLCDNAVKFTPSGAVTLKVTLVNPHSTRSRPPGVNSNAKSGQTNNTSRNHQAVSVFRNSSLLQGGKKIKFDTDESKQTSKERMHRSGVTGPSPHATSRQLNRNASAGSMAPPLSAGDASPMLRHQNLSAIAASGNDSNTGETPPGFIRRVFGGTTKGGTKDSMSQQAKNSSTHSQTGTPIGSPDAPQRQIGGKPAKPIGSTVTSSRALGLDAMGATPKPGARTIREAPAVPAHGLTQFVYLRFSVTDTGIGIDPSAHQAIFEPFQQADMSTTRNFGGTGLGLSICSQLVAQMGGRLKLHSELGQGACFYFSIKCPVVYEQPDEFDEKEEELEEDEEQEVDDEVDAEEEYQRAGEERDAAAAAAAAASSSSPSGVRHNDNIQLDDDIRITFHDPNTPDPLNTTSMVQMSQIQPTHHRRNSSRGGNANVPRTSTVDSNSPPAVQTRITITTPGATSEELAMRSNPSPPTGEKEQNLIGPKIHGTPLGGDASGSPTSAITGLASSSSSSSDSSSSSPNTSTPLIDPPTASSHPHSGAQAYPLPSPLSKVSETMTPSYHLDPLSSKGHSMSSDASANAAAAATTPVGSPVALISSPSDSSTTVTSHNTQVSGSPTLGPIVTNTISPAPLSAATRNARRTTAPYPSRTKGDAASASAASSTAPSASTSTPKDAKDPSLPALHILIAEDNAINVKVLTKLLIREGHTVAVANNGQEALEMYRAQPNLYQLIFMDIMMPIMDGIQATSEIRTVEKDWNRTLEADTLTAAAAGGSAGGSAGNSAAAQMMPQSSVTSSSSYEGRSGANSKANPAGASTSGLPVPNSVAQQKSLPPGLPKSPGGNESSRPSGATEHSLSGVKTASDGNAVVATDPPSDLPVTSSPPPTTAAAASVVSSSSSGDSHVAGGGSSSNGSSVNLPGMGIGSAVRRSTRQVHIPIIACTASAMDSDAEICKKVGMDDVITKPVSVDLLRTKLKAVATRWAHTLKTRARAQRQAQRHTAAANALAAAQTQTSATSATMTPPPPHPSNSSLPATTSISSMTSTSTTTNTSARSTPHAGPIRASAGSVDSSRPHTSPQQSTPSTQPSQQVTQPSIPENDVSNSAR